MRPHSLDKPGLPAALGQTLTKWAPISSARHGVEWGWQERSGSPIAQVTCPEGSLKQPGSFLLSGEQTEAKEVTRLQRLGTV